MLALALMVTLAFLCYWPSIDGALLWDDENLVAANPFIRSPILIGEMFTRWLHPDINTPYYRPIQTISMAADYYFWGLNPRGYHVTNILLHAACGWVLFLLLRKLVLDSGWIVRETNVEIIALAAACIWLIHPAHNAAVAYISGRADPLGFLFAAGAWLLIVSIKASRTRQWFAYAGAMAMMLIALCSKEVSAVWLILFSAHALNSRTLTRNEKLGRLGGCLVIVGIWYLIRQLPSEPALAAQTVDTSFLQRVVLVWRAVGDYATLIVAPVELHMERTLWPEWQRDETTWRNIHARMGFLGWIGVVVGLLAVCSCIHKAPGQKLRTAGCFWFAIAFLPISNAFPLNAQSAEHWIYLASVGAVLLLCGLLLAIPARAQRFAIVGVIVWSGALVVRTHLRAAEWSDPVRFYTQTMESSGGSARIINNLGTSLRRQGRTEQAEQVYRVGAKQYPQNPSILNNLGSLLADMQRHEEAQHFLDRARAISIDRSGPGDERSASRAVLGQARSLMQQGRASEALATIHDARTNTQPDWPVARLECEVLVKMDRLSEAIELVEQRVHSAWWDRDARKLLAKMLERSGKLPEAMEHWRRAADLDVWDAEPFAAIARIHGTQGDLLAAIHYQRKAIKRAPRSSEPRFTLAALLLSADQGRDAAVEFVAARELQALAL
jgi:Flp pilus assembly protein TadD